MAAGVAELRNEGVSRDEVSDIFILVRNSFANAA